MQCVATDMVLGAFILSTYFMLNYSGSALFAGLVICIKYCTFYDYFV